jgi:hypothetical protein
MNYYLLDNSIKIDNTHIKIDVKLRNFNKYMDGMMMWVDYNFYVQNKKQVITRPTSYCCCCWENEVMTNKKVVGCRTGEIIFTWIKDPFSSVCVCVKTYFYHY